MALKTWPTYQSIKTGDPLAEEDTAEIPEEVLDPAAEEAAAAAARVEGWKTRRTPKAKETDLTPNMQGCLLLQAMVKLPGGNEVVLDRSVERKVLQKDADSQHISTRRRAAPGIRVKSRRVSSARCRVELACCFTEIPP